MENKKTVTESLAIAFFAILSVAAIIFFSVILGALMGGLAGWIVGLFFADTILFVLAAFGIKGVTMVQLGIFLGFIGGFLKTKVYSD